MLDLFVNSIGFLSGRTTDAMPRMSIALHYEDAESQLLMIDEAGGLQLGNLAQGLSPDSEISFARGELAAVLRGEIDLGQVLLNDSFTGD